MKLLTGVLDVESVDPVVDRLSKIGDERGCIAVALDARYLIDRAHAERAVALAKRAFRRGENVADTPAIEVLLYVAGRRQIDRALAVGVGAGIGPVAIVIERWASERPGRAQDSEKREGATTEAIERELDTAFDPKEAIASDEALIREFFGIAEPELAATEAGLTALVHERVALLDVEK